MITFQDVAEQTGLPVTFFEELITERDYKLEVDYYFDPDILGDVQFAFTETGYQRLLTDACVPEKAKQRLSLEKPQLDPRELAEEIINNSRNKSLAIQLLTDLFQSLSIDYAFYQLQDAPLPKEDVLATRIAKMYTSSDKEAQQFLDWLCPHHTFGTLTNGYYVVNRLIETRNTCTTFKKELYVRPAFLANKLAELHQYAQEALVKGNYVTTKSHMEFNNGTIIFKIPYSKTSA